MKRILPCSNAIVFFATLIGCSDPVSGPTNESGGVDEELVGVTWSLTSFGRGDTGCEDISLLFKEDGTVEGSGGRNTYAGLYEVSSDELLSIRGPSDAQNIASTRVAVPSCSKYEQYLFTLVKAQSYSVRRQRLTIRSGDGVVLEFEAAN